MQSILNTCLPVVRVKKGWRLKDGGRSIHILLGIFCKKIYIFSPVVCLFSNLIISVWTAAAAAVASVVSDSVRPHRRQPTRLHHPWDSPGKNTGVGCYFLLQCMKVKSESEVAQSCLTLSDPMDCSPPGSSIHGIFQARVLEWGVIAFSNQYELVDIYFILWVISNNTLFNLQILPLLTFGSSFRLAPVFFWHTYLWQTYICLLFLLALLYFLALEDVFWHTYLTQVLHFLALEDPISSSCIFP